MNNSKIIEIKEQYISPQMLPKEQASGWIKWKKGIDFEKLVLKYEADIQIFRLFNVDEEIFQNAEKWNGRIEITKSMIQIDGFFGFTAYYTAIPESDREISYTIEIVNKEITQEIVLTNTITRPMVEVVKASPERIVISKISPPTEPLSVELKGKGNASIRNMSFFIDFLSNNDLQVTITKTKSKKTEVSFSGSPKSYQNIEINGKGNAFIRMGVEYFDDLQTKYSQIIKEIPIIAEEKQHQSIPITHEMNERGAQLLTLVK